MLSERAKELFSDLNMEFPPVAVKYLFTPPENVKKLDKELSFCQFVREAQDSGSHFYIDKENENCFGRVILGMMPKPPLAASGLEGVGFGVYRTPAPNARLHNSYSVLVPGSVNYVEFCPVSICDFSPDLVICVADVKQADILMRASSYISGDLWECRTSCVMSCAWTYVYPYLSGKVNYCITGLHHGMKRREVYPEGRFIISIPYQKLDEVVTALGEMPWELIAMKKDPESKAELKAIMDQWKELASDTIVVSD